MKTQVKFPLIFKFTFLINERAHDEQRWQNNMNKRLTTGDLIDFF